MDPLTISTSAVALITACVQTIQIIKKAIETVKTAKRELMKIFNETNQMRMLLEQLRGLTRQLGSKNNEILLGFDETGCRDVLDEMKRLVDKLAQVELLFGFRFLMRRSKFEALVAELRAQRDGICAVLISVGTELTVYTSIHVERLTDTASVQAVAISSITQSSVDIGNEPPPPFTENADSSSSAEGPIERAGLTVYPPLIARPDSASMGLTAEGQVKDEMDIPNTEDMISLAENDLPSITTAAHRGELGTNAELWSPLTKDDSTLWLPISTSAPLETSPQVDITPATSTFTKLLSRTVIWHGQLSRYLYDDEYLRRRDALADAAYAGNWEDVKATIDDAHERGLRSWPNCYRIGSSMGPTGWTPLHQAAFLCAPESAVKMLVERGASRTLRTVWTSPSELPFRNMTALEIARSLGFKHLFDILSPVIHYSPLVKYCISCNKPFITSSKATSPIDLKWLICGCPS